MLINSEQQPRKKIRLPEYNYRISGYYFVTLCTHQRQCLFGEVSDENMQLNAPGKLMKNIFKEIPTHYIGWDVDTLIVMPNHLHFVVFLSEKMIVDRTQFLSLPELLRNIKSLTMNIYSEGVQNKNWTAFDKHLWQRGYYEHIIRNERSLEKIREYILNNPKQWELDHDNPKNILKK